MIDLYTLSQSTNYSTIGASHTRYITTTISSSYWLAIGQETSNSSHWRWRLTPEAVEWLRMYGLTVMRRNSQRAFRLDQRAQTDHKPPEAL